MIDIRCTGRLPFLPPGDASRCQLVAGHEGPHALMFSRDGQRIVRTWNRSGRLALSEHVAEQESAPWARGKPEPAWAEDGVGERVERQGDDRFRLRVVHDLPIG